MGLGLGLGLGLGFGFGFGFGLAGTIGAWDAGGPGVARTVVWPVRGVGVGVGGGEHAGQGPRFDFVRREQWSRLTSALQPLRIPGLAIMHHRSGPNLPPRGPPIRCELASKSVKSERRLQNERGHHIYVHGKADNVGTLNRFVMPSQLGWYAANARPTYTS